MKKEVLGIKLLKAKVMVFAKRPIKYRWQVNGITIEQVMLFKYLGIVFSQENVQVRVHVATILNAFHSTPSIIKEG